MKFTNSLGQELNINDIVVFDDMIVTTETGVYTPKASVKHQYRKAKITEFRPLKKMVKANIEFDTFNGTEKRDININYLIKI